MHERSWGGNALARNRNAAGESIRTSPTSRIISTRRELKKERQGKKARKTRASQKNRSFRSGLVAEQANDALFFVDKGEFDIRDGGNDRDRVLFAGTEPPSAKRPKIAVSSKSTKDEDATARKAETKTKTIRAVVKSKRPKRRKDHVSEDLWKDKGKSQKRNFSRIDSNCLILFHSDRAAGSDRRVL